MNKILIIIVAILFPLVSMAQGGKYVSIDPDSYTNVREKPNANAKILGMVDRFHIFTVPSESCYDPTDEIYEAVNWMPVLISEYPKFEVGYIYKKYVRGFDDFQKLALDVAEDSMSGYFEDKDMRMSIILQLTDLEKYENEDNLDNYYKRNSPYEFNSISAIYEGKEYFVAESEMENAYLSYNSLTMEGGGSAGPDIYAYKGHEGIYYLIMHGGDGADVYNITWVFDRGELVYTESEVGHCTIAPLNLIRIEE